MYEKDDSVTCQNCIFFQACYSDDRDDPSDELEASDLDLYTDDDFFDDDENNEFLAYISSL